MFSQERDKSRFSSYAKKTKHKTVHYFSFINSPIRQLLEEYDTVNLFIVFFTVTKRDDLSRRIDMLSLYFHIIWELQEYFSLICVGLGCFRLNIYFENQSYLAFAFNFPMFGKFKPKFLIRIQIQIFEGIIFQRNESFQVVLVQILDSLPVIISCLITSLIYFFLDLCYLSTEPVVAATELYKGKLF